MILAAGRARRLGADRPKCLLEFDGRTLLERHLAALASLGVRKATIVVGHLADRLREACPRVPGIEVRFATNERFAEGSILSMIVGLDAAGDDDLLVMDADVLYEREVLRRLIAAPGSALLMDDSAEETGEEMMLGARGGRVLAIARRVGKDWDAVGEGVGFLRVERALKPRLREIAAKHVEEGHPDVEYEDAIHRLMQEHPIGYVPVGGLAWTEIDFPEDVAKAERDVLPRIAERDPVPGADRVLDNSLDPANRFVRYPLSNLVGPIFRRLPFTANQISVFHGLVGLAAAFLVARGGRTELVAAAILYEFRLFLDCLDGVVARAKGTASAGGRALDELADTVNFFALLGALGWNLHRSGLPSIEVGLVVLLGFVSIAATAGAHVFYRRKLSAALKTGTDAVREDLEIHRARLATGGGLAARLSYAINWLEIRVLSPASFAAAPAGAPSPEVHVLRRDATTPRLMPFLLAVAMAGGDNHLLVIDVALAAGRPLLGILAASAYSVLALLLVMVLARRALA